MPKIMYVSWNLLHINLTLHNSQTV